MSRIKDCILAVFRWYGAKWTHPLLIFQTLTVPLALCSFLYVFDSGFHVLIENSYQIILLLQIGHIACACIAGIILLIRKHIGRALVYWLECVFFFCITMCMCVWLVIISLFFDYDHFADNLKLPENVELTEPLDSNFNLVGKDGQIADEFQKQVVSAIGKGPVLEPAEECHIPALERLMATPAGKQKVLDYLAASPYWSLRYNKADGLYATRQSLTSDREIDCRGYFFIDPARDCQTGEQIGNYAEYSICIYLDEYLNCRFAKKGKDFGCVVNQDNDDIIDVRTWLKAGTARIEICDHSKYFGRQMTTKISELLNREFERLEKGIDLKTLGKKSSSTEIKLYNGVQGGIYCMDIWCNPGETGTLSLRAKEITQGTQLSQDRINKYQTKTYGCPDKDVIFHNSIAFTIYEGNWGQYYGANIELWFTPDSGQESRMLWSGNFRIEGWMR